MYHAQNAAGCVLATSAASGGASASRKPSCNNAAKDGYTEAPTTPTDGGEAAAAATAASIAEVAGTAAGGATAGAVGCFCCWLPGARWRVGSSTRP